MDDTHPRELNAVLSKRIVANEMMNKIHRIRTHLGRGDSKHLVEHADRVLVERGASGIVNYAEASVGEPHPADILYVSPGA
jgi:hypothetical protein